MSSHIWQERIKKLSQEVQQDREELTKVFLLFSYLFLVVTASTVSRTAADSLFLSRYDSSVLSYMYLPQAVAMILIGLLYQRLCARFRIDQLIPGVILLTAILSFISRILITFEFNWIYPVIYIGYDILNFLMIVSF